MRNPDSCAADELVKGDLVEAVDGRRFREPSIVRGVSTEGRYTRVFIEQPDGILHDIPDDDPDRPRSFRLAAR